MKLENASEDDTKKMLTDLERRLGRLETRGGNIWAAVSAALSLGAAVGWFSSAAGQKSATTVADLPVAAIFNTLSVNANLLAASASCLAALAAVMSFSRS
ncbi:hypothetical protein ACQ858_14830 [Variovorax ureilyticus]|uniref:hypothetical protein n=1 Tax=Variovorax ureilyticus TaxID=1836198 RepID=UPI003D6670DF